MDQNTNQNDQTQPQANDPMDQRDQSAAGQPDGAPSQDPLNQQKPADGSGSNAKKWTIAVIVIIIIILGLIFFWPTSEGTGDDAADMTDEELADTQELEEDLDGVNDEEFNASLDEIDQEFQ